MDGSYSYQHTNMSGGTYGSQDDSASTHGHEMDFEVSDLLEFNDWMADDPALSSYSTGYNTQNVNYSTDEVGVNSGEIGSSSVARDGAGVREKKTKKKVAFKTKSEVEILDDGFKWRKYGKKMVKNSPNPRNYYKCSVEGCPVKKQVERDKEDPRYVVTTYEGVHNHQGPMH